NRTHKNIVTSCGANQQHKKQKTRAEGFRILVLSPYTPTSTSASHNIATEEAPNGSILNEADN
ncbi:hypothetical protein ACHAXH_007146, partial [Discostella pseudostelligera]